MVQQLHAGGAVAGGEEAYHAGDDRRGVLLRRQPRADVEDGSQHDRAAAACGEVERESRQREWWQ